MKMISNERTCKMFTCEINMLNSTFNLSGAAGSISSVCFTELERSQDTLMSLEKRKNKCPCLAILRCRLPLQIILSSPAIKAVTAQ